MYAIVDFKGTQLKVVKDEIVKVPFLSEQEIGSKVEISRVLFLKDGEDIKIGQPTIEGARIDAEVINHFKDKKVIVFKKKRRKGYQKKNGHRQKYTEIKINEIVN
ncbi:MAG: 50S ribosomal protein L21 [Candidatus Cloacimonetes bacterium]|jgi:large subunit ribosomal protein L21|nr:50S ribosomal protein L21 [Candidatus Cloacimonadota bacterium]MBT7470329.1 50S ribosomal protein L21 [Candidatus Cloacimonadota bacterium]